MKDVSSFDKRIESNGAPVTVYGSAKVGSYHENKQNLVKNGIFTNQNQPKTLETFQLGKLANLERSNLNYKQKEKVQELFMRHQQVFSRNSNDLGYCYKSKHQIKLNKDAQPFRRSYCSLSFDKQKALKKIVEDLEDTKLIEPTHSYWAPPSVFLKKKDGSYRLFVDYIGLNKQIENTSWPLPRINDVIDSLDRNCYFSNINLTSGYFKMSLEKELQKVTAFLAPIGLYKWRRLPMGLASAPGVFQNLIDLIIAGISYDVSLVYLDHIIIIGRSFQEHLNRLDLVLRRF